MSGTSTTVRLAEALAALSLATDVGNGLALETSLREAIVAARLADRADLAVGECAEAFYVALLSSIGCVAHAHENAALLGGDDIAFESLWHRLDPGRTGEFAKDVLTGMGAWAPPLQRPRIVVRFLRIAPKVAPYAGRAACEVSRSLARRVGLAEGVARGVTDAQERFDGRGVPGGLRGEAVALPARVAHVAKVAVLGHRPGDPHGALEAIRHRRGGHLDPRLVDVASGCVDDLLAGLDEGDALALALEAEPGAPARLSVDDLESLALALADFADLKSPWTLGHTSRTADLAAAAVGAEAAGTVAIAALLHDLGRVSVPNGIWDKPTALSSGEWERVRLHPHWTQRILARTPAFAATAALAATDHERLNGIGYHRGLEASSLGRDARVLAAADAYTAMTSARPHRPALTSGGAAAELRSEAREGRLCTDAVEAVLDAAGHPPRRRPERAHGLTEREIEVLRLAARGLTNKQIAAQLVVSPRTVQHHLAHVYEKTGRRTRAGAALFAMEHGLTR